MVAWEQNCVEVVGGLITAPKIIKCYTGRMGIKCYAKNVSFQCHFPLLTYLLFYYFIILAVRVEGEDSMFTLPGNQFYQLSLCR